MAKTQPVPQCPTVRTYQRGSKWWFDVRTGGRRVRQPGGRTQAQAEASGAQFVASGAQQRAAGTVGAIFDTWLAYQNTYGRKQRTVSATQNSAARLERYFGGDSPLDEPDTDAIAGFVRWRQSGPRSVGAYAINRDLATLRAAWRHAVEDGKSPSPPKFRVLDTDEGGSAIRVERSKPPGSRRAQVLVVVLDKAGFEELDLERSRDGRSGVRAGVFPLDGEDLVGTGATV